MGGRCRAGCACRAGSGKAAECRSGLRGLVWCAVRVGWGRGCAAAEFVLPFGETSCGGKSLLEDIVSPAYRGGPDPPAAMLFAGWFQPVARLIQVIHRLPAV